MVVVDRRGMTAMAQGFHDVAKMLASYGGVRERASVSGVVGFCTDRLANEIDSLEIIDRGKYLVSSRWTPKKYFYNHDSPVRLFRTGIDIILLLSAVTYQSVLYTGKTYEDILFSSKLPRALLVVE